MIVESNAFEHVVRKLAWVEFFTYVEKVPVELADGTKVTAKHGGMAPVNFGRSDFILCSML